MTYGEPEQSTQQESLQMGGQADPAARPAAGDPVAEVDAGGEQGEVGQFIDPAQDRGSVGPEPDTVAERMGSQQSLPPSEEQAMRVERET